MATGNDEGCDMFSNALILARIAEVAMTEAVEVGDKIDAHLGHMADCSQDLYAVAGNTSGQYFHNRSSLKLHIPDFCLIPMGTEASVSPKARRRELF